MNRLQQMNGRYCRLLRELDDLRRGEAPDAGRIGRLEEDISATMREIELLRRRGRQYANATLAFVH